MKYSFLAVIILIVTEVVYSQEYSGVNYRAITFQDALLQARQENKLIFIDCYTSWCMPCAYMNTSVFPEKEVGQLLNVEFVCLQIDMEKGKGLDIKQQYTIDSYPTFLILNAEGKEIHRFSGAMPTEMFLKQIKKGLNPQTSTSAMEQKYVQGERTVSFLSEYLPMLYRIGKFRQLDKALAELRECLTDEQKQSSAYWWLFENSNLTPYGSPEFEYLIENWKEFCKSNSKDKVNFRIQIEFNQVLQNYLSEPTEIAEQRETRLKELKHIASVLRRNRLNTPGLMAKSEIARAKFTCPDDQFLSICRKELTKMSDEDVYRTYSVITQGGLGSYTSDQQDYILETGKIQAGRMLGQGYKNALLELIQQLSDQCNRGVVFFEGDLSQAMEKAKTENKYVFVDCYTSWCVPCKYMLSRVFPLKQVGDFFRDHFVAVKLDMEKEEGIKIRDQYQVQVYPTFLILTAAGNEQHRILGSCQPEEFLEKLNIGVHYETSAACQHLRYESGERDEHFIASYVKLLLEVYQEDLARHIVDSLMNQLTDQEKQSPQYWWMFSDERLAPYGSAYFRYILAHQQGFKKQNGDLVVRYLVAEIAKLTEPFILGTAQMVDEEGSKRELAAIKKLVDDNQLGVPELLARLKIAEASCSGNPDAYITTFDEQLACFKLDEKISLYNLFAVGLLQNNQLSSDQWQRVKKTGIRLLPELITQEQKEWMEGLFNDFTKRLNISGV